jgi:hypothetical protein
MSAPRYWAFISYSSHDARVARWLQRAIETWPVPRRLVGAPTPAGPAPRRFSPLFRDRSELAAEADLATRLTAALEASAYLIVVCSPQAAASRWVDEEIRQFRDLHGPGRILAVIAEGGEGPAREAAFPPALRYRDEAGGRIGAEPIAADLRPGGDGRRLARLKLVAGMLGVGLDEIIHREAQRRAGRLTAIAIAASVGATAMAGLAALAIVSRNEARLQRDQAEGLIETMLTDLRGRLEPVGRLDLMDGVGAKALAYYAAQDPASLDAASLERRARALQLMGQINLNRGHPDLALAAFRQAAATTGELLARKPGDGERIFAHAQSVYWVGEVAYETGDSAAAERGFATYLTLAESLTRLDPGRDDWRMEVGYATYDLGALYLAEGRTSAAAATLTRSLQVWQDLRGRRPADTDVAANLAEALAWQSEAFEQQGRLAEARAQRLAELALYRGLLAKNANLADARFGVIVAERALARQAFFGGDSARAVAGYRDVVAKAEAQLKLEPDNVRLSGEVVVTQLELGEALLAEGLTDAAEAARLRALQLLAAAPPRGQDAREWRQHRARAHLLQAAILATRKDAPAALRLDQAVLGQLPAKSTGATDTRWLADRARFQAGDALAMLGRRGEARVAWSAVEADLAGPPAPTWPRLAALRTSARRRLAASSSGSGKAPSPGWRRSSPARGRP